MDEKVHHGAADFGPPDVERDCGDDDGANHDALRRCRHRVEVEGILDDDDGQCADDGFDDRAAATGQTGAADNTKMATGLSRFVAGIGGTQFLSKSLA